VWSTGTNGSGADRLELEYNPGARSFMAVYNPFTQTIAWGWLGGAPFTPNPCVWGSEATYIQSDYMVNGNVYSLTIQPLMAACANKCVQDRANHCVAFSWYEPNDWGVIHGVVPNHGCFLRNGISGQYSEPGVISGFIGGRTALGQTPNPTPTY